jgi:hypothetical protein
MRCWIKAHIKEMPQNLVSWNGGMEVGLGNGIYDLKEERVKETVEDIINFQNGYYKWLRITSIKSELCYTYL